jgi:hypothetical protein
MNFIDPYIFPIVVFLPLVAALFITLIPTKDMGSKLVISRLFAVISFIAFLRLFFLFLNQALEEKTSLSFRGFNFQISFNLFLTKHTILLYGASALALVAHMSSHIVLTKTYV